MKLSIILPTYNNERTLAQCLRSIHEQDLPRSAYEVLVVDGGSGDKTREIVRAAGLPVLENPFRVEERGRMIGIEQASGEILCFLDADNVLVGTDWLRRMLAPFEDREIAFADSLHYAWRRGDRLSVRYQALIGGDDPLATYLGLYSRWCHFTGDWTGFPYESERRGGYLKVRLRDRSLVPAMGSNGFFVRSGVLRPLLGGEFIHTDVVYDLVNSGFDCFAKVFVEILHDQPSFFASKRRRIRRRWEGDVRQRYGYGIRPRHVLRVMLRAGAILPVVLDALRGYRRKPDLAWAFHLPAVYGVLGLHAYYGGKAWLRA